MIKTYGIVDLFNFNLLLMLRTKITLIETIVYSGKFN